MFQEAEMLAEAATIETAWVVEPPFLEILLDQEVKAFCTEQVCAQEYTVHYLHLNVRLNFTDQQQIPGDTAKKKPINRMLLPV